MVTDPKVIQAFTGQERGAFAETMDGAPEMQVQTALDRMGTPHFGRVNIPLRDRHAYPRLADMLRGLANEMDAIGRAAHLNDYEAVRDGYQRIGAINRHMKAIADTPQSWAGRDTQKDSE